ncbi:DoxX family protein [uncultured Maricaulis sp.]|uniref:DoxX family protein n=1 Tax=uncultured Maricaulis sp. TaxID=174710 RepID=UPI0030D8E876|tara:strand:+ start:85637 stop:86182 length:546 start_codon:yes stop_codon:yes gene_type:complete
MTIAARIKTVPQAHQRLIELVQRFLAGDVLKLLARLTLAGVFWRSLLTKVQTAGAFSYTEMINDFAVQRSHLRLPEIPLSLKASTLTLFETEYALPLIPTEIAAWMATLAEFSFPILLVLGLLTRFSALALLGMTLVIQVFVYPEAWWSAHALWVVMAIFLAGYGPGRVSIDHWAGRHFAR